MSPAAAHPPYFGDRQTVQHPEFGPVTYAVLYGDGIIAADPAQVIVYNEEGLLLAATPWSLYKQIICPGSAPARGCAVYDETGLAVFEPDYPAWATGRPIAVDGRPPRDAYPQHTIDAYGFTERPATVGEMVWFTARTVLARPIPALLGTLWWCLAWSLLARLFWQWKRNRWRLWPVRMGTTFKVIFAPVVFLVLAAVPVLTWLHFPTPWFYFLLLLTLGTVLAFVWTRPRPPVA